MYDLGRMGIADMTVASSRLRKLGDGATTMEDAAQRVSKWMFESFGHADTGEPGCVLVRVYTTRPLGDLPAELQRFARESWGGTLDSDTRCLVLLGSVGLEPDWCNRTTSRGHKAIPLPSADAVARLPMVASLVGQLGISVAEIVRQGPALAMVDPSERTYNVFHVESAAGSPYIPAQDFVERYAVRSVLGCGGLLPDGELYAAILFSRMGIGEETADLFRPLALALKLALIPFKKGRIFRDESSSADAAV